MVALFHEWSLSTTIKKPTIVNTSTLYRVFMAMVYFRILTAVLSLQTAMAERFYNVVTTTSTASLVDKYQESSAADLFCFKHQSASTPGSCAILCTKENDLPCQGFTVTVEQKTGRIICNLGKG